MNKMVMECLVSFFLLSDLTLAIYIYILKKNLAKSKFCIEFLSSRGLEVFGAS